MGFGSSRPDTLLNFYAHVLDASADIAETLISGQRRGDFNRSRAAHVISKN